MIRRALPWMLALVAITAHAAGDAPEVTLSVDADEVTVGDVFSATVEATWPADVRLNLPERPAHLGDAEVRSVETETDEPRPGISCAVIRYRLTLWEVGEGHVRAPAITWRSRDGEARELERPEATVTVASVLPEGAEEIKDIRGPREIPLEPVHYVLAALPLLLLAAGIVAAVVVLRRRGAAEEDEEPAAPLPPGEEALAALDALEGDELVGAGQIKAHYVRLSRIVRRYVQRRWGLAALKETTGMLGRSMRDSGRVPGGPAKRIVGLLRRSDLAKFARHRPGDAQARSDVQTAREIVRETARRREEAEGPADTASAAAAS